jgi:hypothetical protein
MQMRSYRTVRVLVTVTMQVRGHSPVSLGLLAGDSSYSTVLWSQHSFTGLGPPSSFFSFRYRANWLYDVGKSYVYDGMTIKSQSGMRVSPVPLVTD